MFRAIDQVSPERESLDVVWDLGRKCTYACTYCGPHHSNKTSPNTPLKTLIDTIDGVVEYTEILNKYRKIKKNTTLAFTGGEPTINPDFFKFIKYIKENYPNLKCNVTTNGCYTPRKAEMIMEYCESTTLSWHAEATKQEKKLVRDNIQLMSDRDYHFKINLMFHKDYFDECILMSEWFEEMGVKYIPRVIGDSGNKSDIEDGTAHVYDDEQMSWFKEYWEKENEQISKKTSCEGTSIGRPCCNRMSLSLLNDDVWSMGTFAPSTNFEGWNCMVNWNFLFIHSELDEVWHHQTCQINLEGEIGPIGKASNFVDINKLLRDELEAGSIRVIKCPKSWCGCGMCAPKAKDEDVMDNIFNKYVDDSVTPIYQPKKELTGIKIMTRLK